MLRSLAVASLLGLTLASPIDIASRATKCYSGVYMIVARGSNEAAGEGAPASVAGLVQQALPDSGSVAVNYPATITDPSYPSSVSAGINDTINKIHAYVDACGSSSKVALIGYSQGGNVMTDVLAGGVDKPQPLSAAYAKHVTAVTVFGDPSFTVGQSFDVGNATKSGIFARGGNSLALLNTYAGAVRSYCMIHDTFCASGDSLNTHYAEVPTFQKAAANFIVGKNK